MRKLFLLCALITAALNLRPIITSVAPLLHALQQELGMNGAVASLLTTLPVLCMGIFAPLGTVLRARFGLERTIFFSILLIGAATAVRGILGSVAILVVSAFIGGVGISLAGPMLSSFIKKYFPTKPHLVSYYTAALTIGAASASAFSVHIYEWSKQSFSLALSSWSLLAVVALLFWSLLLSKRYKSAQLSASSAQSSASSAQMSGKSRLPLRNKRAILLTLLFGCLSGIFYTVTAWISPIALNLGYSQTSAAMLLTLFTLIQLPVTFIFPSLAAKFGNYRMLLIICSLFELIGIILLLLHLPVLPAVICLGIGAGGLFSLALMLPIAETATWEEAGSWSAMSQCGGYTLGAMGPLLVGAIYDYFGSFQVALYSILIVILLMITVQLFLVDTKRAAQVQR